MKPILLAALSATAALVLGTGSASAARTASFPTQVGYSGPFNSQDFTGIMFGSVASPKRACITGRTVKLFINQSGSLVLTDTDRTSSEGVWAARTPVFGDGKVTVTRRVIGPRGHRTVCSAGSLVLD